MKFFTPEWYNDTIVADMHSQMRKTQSAAEFSEKFYEKLYKLEKKAFLRHSKRAAKFSREKFDAMAAEKQFDANYEENLAFVKANLPAEILDRVKDIRVLALGSAEYDVAADIERFCGRVQRECKAVEAAYDEELENVATIVGWDTIHALDTLIGSPIESVNVCDNGKITVVTAGDPEYPSYTVTLDGAQMLTPDVSVMGAVIAQHELTRGENGLLLGILCVGESAGAVACEFSASKISIAKSV
jgi:hypothetical protein